MSEIEQKVMGSVAAIYVGRKLTSLTAIKLYVLAASLIGIASLDSLPHVVANLMHVGIGGAGLFALVAVEKTSLIVQVALFAGAVALISLMTEVARNNRISEQRWAL